MRGSGVERRLVLGRGSELEPALLERVAARRAADPLAPLLLVTPGAAQGARLLDLLAEHDLGLGVRALTLEGLADHLLRRAGLGPGRELPPGGELLLVERVLAELQASKELRALGELAASPGLHAALAATLRDLRDAGVAPDELPGSGPQGDVAGDLRRICARVEELRAPEGPGALDLADDRRRLTSAAALLDAGVPVDWDFALVAGLYDPTGVQEQLVMALARRPEPLDLFVPWVAGDPSRAFAEPFAERLQALPGVEAVAAEPLEPAGATAGAAMLAAACDRLAGDAGAKLAAGALQVLSVPGGVEGARALAREAARLVDEGFCAANELAVLTRTPGGDTEDLRRALAAPGLPVEAARTTLGATPAGRVVAGLAAFLRERRVTRADLLDWAGTVPWRVGPDGKLVLGDGPPVDPRGTLLADWDALTREARATRLLDLDGPDSAGAGGTADLRAVAGVERHLRRRAEQLRAREDDEPQLLERAARFERQADAVAPLLALVEQLRGALARAGEGGSWPALAADLTALLEHLIAEPGPQASNGDGESNEIRVEGRAEVLEGVARLARLEALGLPVSPARAARALHALLDREVAEPAGPTAATGAAPEAAVRLSSLPRQRGARAAVVLFWNAVEGVFPRTRRTDPLLPDSERERLAETHPTLAGDLRAMAEERQLFAELLDLTARRLVLVVPRDDPHGSGAPPVPGRFVLDAVEWISGERPRSTDWMLGPEAEPADREESGDLRRVGVEESWSGEPARALDDGELVLRWADRELTRAPMEAGRGTRGRVRAGLATLDDALARGARMEDARFEREGYGPYDGALPADVAELLRAAQPPRSTSRVTSLEQYARCPHQYFLRRVVGLVPVERPEDRVGIDAADRGTLVHGVLHRFGETCAANGWLPWSGADDARRAELATLLRELVGEEVGRARGRDAKEREGEWTAQHDRIERGLLRWLRRQIDEPGEPEKLVPDAFEWAIDPPVPFALDDGGEPLLLQGRADRIDRSPDGKRVRAVDYKTGSGAGLKRNSLEQGEQLQLPLYALAALARAGGGTLGGEWGRYELVLHDRRLEFDAAKVDEARVRRVVGELVRGLESGWFAPRPDDRDPRNGRCGTCDFEAVCGPWRYRVHAVKQESDRVRSGIERADSMEDAP